MGDGLWMSSRGVRRAVERQIAGAVTRCPNARWQPLALPERGVLCAYETRTRSGIGAVFSVDEMPRPLGAQFPAGLYRHLSLSRPDRYPEWDEMRDFVYASGLFDPEADIVMVLPPSARPGEYINVHPNCFHWWQWTGGAS